MKAIAYIRVSTDDQNIGPEARLEAIQEWTKADEIYWAKTQIKNCKNKTLTPQ